MGVLILIPRIIDNLKRLRELINDDNVNDAHEYGTTPLSLAAYTISMLDN